MTDAERLPCLEPAGALVLAYLDEHGRLCRTLDLDSAEDRLCHGAELTVPVQLRISDTVIAPTRKHDPNRRLSRACRSRPPRRTGRGCGQDGSQQHDMQWLAGRPSP